MNIYSDESCESINKTFLLPYLANVSLFPDNGQRIGSWVNRCIIWKKVVFAALCAL